MRIITSAGTEVIKGQLQGVTGTCVAVHRSSLVHDRLQRLGILVIPKGVDSPHEGRKLHDGQSVLVGGGAKAATQSVNQQLDSALHSLEIIVADGP